MGRATMNSIESMGKMQSFKDKMLNVAEGCPVREFKPLKSHWSVTGYDRQNEVEQFMHGYKSKGSDK